MRNWSRRELLLAGASGLVLAACRNGSSSIGGAAVGSLDPSVERRDALRRVAGAKTVTATVRAAPVTTMIGGREVATWAFGDRPGQGGIRVAAGDVLEATFVNDLTSANTVHWHGIALRNDMDGVHDLTQSVVEPGGRFTYRFTVPDPGTYWFHPHMGLELDRGLYAPLIVEDPKEPLVYDVDAVLMLDDWLDGFGRTQEEVLQSLQQYGGHSGMMGGTGASTGGMGGMSGHAGMGASGSSNAGTGSNMGGLSGDVAYPLHVINGRAPADRDVVQVAPGQRVRLRLINAGSDTAYRVAVSGHRLTVTHADGFPVDPVEVDNVELGMGERYDVILTAQSGKFAVVARPIGKSDPAAEALLVTSDGSSAPPVGTSPTELSGRTLAYTDLAARDAVRLPGKTPDRTETITLTASMNGYTHGIDGASYPASAPILVREGERLRLKVVNATMMFHPIHLHGHTFQVVGAGSARKDTLNVLPMTTATVDVQADNPGQWMLHCHNTYHFETGMATVLSYRS